MYAYCLVLSLCIYPLAPASRASAHPSILYSLLPPSTTANVLTKPVSTDLLPLNLLSCDGQLPPQTLESTLAQTTKSLVKILLVLLLRCGDLAHDFARTCAGVDVQGDILVCE